MLIGDTSCRYSLMIVFGTIGLLIQLPSCAQVWTREEVEQGLFEPELSTSFES